MLGDFYDPEQQTRAEILRSGFLNNLVDVKPKILKDLHKDVLPLYRDLVEGTRSKEVARLLGVAREMLESRPAHPWKSPSAILDSLAAVAPAVSGFDLFRVAFAKWSDRWTMVDTWIHDEVLYRLAVWVLHPETEKLIQPPAPDWSLWLLEVEEQKKQIAKIKRKANSAKLSKEDRAWYKKELRSLEENLKKGRESVKEDKRIVREKRVPRYRWVLHPPLPPPSLPRPVPIRVTQSVYESEPFQSLLRHGGVYETKEFQPIRDRLQLVSGRKSPNNHVAPTPEVRYPLPAPPLEAFDELTERWTSYKERMDKVLAQYRESVYDRAIGPRQVADRTLTGGLAPLDTREGAGDPFMWLAKHHAGATYGEVASQQRAENDRKGKRKRKGKKKQTPEWNSVAIAIRACATDIDLTLRPTPGRKDPRKR